MIDPHKDSFNAYSKYYDLLYQDKDYTEEVTYLKKLIHTYQPQTQSILELGCGTGNHALHFGNTNFEITGIEQSESMVALAMAKSIPNFNAVQGNIMSFELNKKFDCALSLFHVISYLTSNDDILACFKQTAKHLNPRGIFVFDAWYSPAVYSQIPATRIKRMEDDDIEVIRLAEPVMHIADNVVDVNYQIMIKNKSNGEYQQVNEKHPMRHFSEPEMALLAQNAGFKLLKAEEFLTANKPGTNTWGVCFVLQKTENE